MAEAEVKLNKFDSEITAVGDASIKVVSSVGKTKVNSSTTSPEISPTFYDKINMF